ncbi:hypothetical protein HPB49_014329 [Dermacentor silvarum]|uniref:Uncharacterized protein n=1 Tax=Dermacentor silvarum TaxID=543639 RepID=A0ACB8CL56_DERSI|nr:hypothetical protein HPB49_014329 [Dermacentor silvarum]
MGDDESSGSELRSLNELFDRGFNLYLEIEKSTESANEKSYQDKVREAATQFENATHLVNEAGLFSENEEIDEVATHHLKFLLLPALLGSLTQKKVAVDRSEILRLSEVYFRDFLRRCRQYGVTSYELPETKDDDVPDEKAAAATKKSETDSLLDACRKRKEKIARFTEQKAMEERQRQLKDLISSPTVDDEVLREYYNVLLKYWVNNSIEELRSIEEEKPILQYMAKVKAQGKPTHEASTQQQPKKIPPGTEARCLKCKAVLKTPTSTTTTLATHLRRHPDLHKDYQEKRDARERPSKLKGASKASGQQPSITDSFKPKMKAWPQKPNR